MAWLLILNTNHNEDDNDWYDDNDDDDDDDDDVQGYLTGKVSLTPHTPIILTQWLIILDTNPPEKFWKQCYSIISITGTSRLGIRIKRGKSSLHNSDKPVELDSFASVAEPNRNLSVPAWIPYLDKV